MGGTKGNYKAAPERSYIYGDFVETRRLSNGKKRKTGNDYNSLKDAINSLGDPVRSANAKQKTQPIRYYDENTNELVLGHVPVLWKRSIEHIEEQKGNNHLSVSPKVNPITSTDFQNTLAQISKNINNKNKKDYKRKLKESKPLNVRSYEDYNPGFTEFGTKRPSKKELENALRDMYENDFIIMDGLGQYQLSHFRGETPIYSNEHHFTNEHTPNIRQRNQFDYIVPTDWNSYYKYMTSLGNNGLDSVKNENNEWIYQTVVSNDDPRFLEHNKPSLYIRNPNRDGSSSTGDFKFGGNINMRRSLKCGGKPRKKALFGEAAAILTAAGIQAATQAATSAAQIAAEQKNASMQSKSITDSAAQQAKAISDANIKDVQTQEKAIQMQKDAHQDDIEQQKQIQTTLQMMAAQQNQNDIDENQKAAVKFGGKPKFSKRKRIANIGTQSTLSYGGAGLPFKITDGGGVIPLQIDNNGFGLYEIYGNDHEHYHKTKGGKNKTGVGFKFPDGSVVEGEGNQNSNNGELLFFTPNGAEFISKHTLRKGNKTSKFNPAEAVKQGMNPQEAFNRQEIIKSMLGLKDDGSNAKYGTYRQLKCGGNPRTKADLGYLTTSLGKPIDPSSIPIKGPNLGSTNGTSKFSSLIGSDFWNNYGGAIIGGAANLLTGAAQGISNYFAGAKMANAYRTAGNTMANAYANLKTIDPSLIKDGDFDAAHALAAVQTTNLNANRDIEKIDRMGNTLKQGMKNSTLSSAALRQGFTTVDDRMQQAKLDADSKVKEQIDRISQGNAERITQVANENANRDMQARRDTVGYKLELAKYNNDIENEKILGVANSKANGLLQHSNALTSGFTSGVNNLMIGTNAAGQGFANAMQTKVNNDFMLDSTLLGASDANKVTYYLQHDNKSAAKALYDRLKLSTNADDIKFVQALKDKYKFS